MTPLVASLLLFVAVGVGFIFVHLLAGKVIRPHKPAAEKGTIYECGEPTIGSAWIQFDLRFYVVALLFVIFDVEVAFFFPWAEVFGKANALVAQPVPASEEERLAYGKQALELAPPYNAERLKQLQQAPPLVQAREGREIRAERDRFRIMTGPTWTPAEQEAFQALVEENRQAAHNLAWLAFLEILVFFGVLLVGFAYLWRRGDLAWVRSTLAERISPPIVPPEPVREERRALVEAGSH
jgi:NADH-quinone oxidoreductase subunit A